MSQPMNSYSNRDILRDGTLENISETESYFQFNYDANIPIDLDFIDIYLNSLEHYGLLDSKLYEMELRFFQNKQEYGGISNTLNPQQFKNIKEFLDTNFDKINSSGLPEYTLDITPHSNNYVDFSDELSKLRFTISGKTGIYEFCKTNNININNSDTSLIFKGDLPRTFVDPSTPNLSHVEREYNRNFNKSSLDQTYNIIDLYSSKSRLGGKIEMEYDSKSKTFDYKNEFENDIIKDVYAKATKTYDKFRSLERRQKNMIYKTFRLKERYSYKYHNIRFDLTKTKSSKIDIDVNFKETYIPVTEFINSGVSDSVEEYEFEIEILNTKEHKRDAYAIRHALEIFMLINTVVNERLIYTDNITSESVTEIYSEVIRKLLIDRIENKLKLLTNQSALAAKIADPNTKPWDLSHKINSLSSKDKAAYISKLEKYRSNYDREDNTIDRFFSPKVVSINMDNIRENNPESIIRDYCVTDKADGLSSLLLVIGRDILVDTGLLDEHEYLIGYSFLIDSNLKISFTGLKHDTEDTYLFNGEFLNYTKSRNIMNEYGIFDTYIYANKDVSNLELVSNDKSIETRISLANKFNLEITNTNVLENNVHIFVKKFLVPNLMDQDIFSVSKQIWDSKDIKEYKLDGLIYTPTNYPVAFSDDIDYDLNPWFTWTKNLKWKPPEDNTIDFLIRFEQEVVSTYNNNTIYKNKIKKIKSTGNGGYDNFIIGNLFNLGKEGIPTQDPCNIKHLDLRKYKTKPIPFSPLHPIEEDIHFALLKTSPYNNEITDLEGHPVNNDTIVEINYMNFDPSTSSYIPNKNRRFNILRTRHDKTYEHRIAKNKQKIIFNRINKVVDLIENNDTLNTSQKKFVHRNERTFSKFIKPGLSIMNNSSEYIANFKKSISRIKSTFRTYEDIDFSGIKLNYGNAVSVAHNIWSTIHNPITPEMITTGENIPCINDEAQVYYNRKDNEFKDKSITYDLQTFHNKIIKSRILLENAVNAIRKEDPSKQINLLDLACGKGGDIGKWNDLNINNVVGIDIVYNNIHDDVDGACERYNFYKNKYTQDRITNIEFLVGDISKNIVTGDAFKSYPQYVNKFESLWISQDGPLYVRNKFNIISIMFAMHYLFENKTKLTSLIDNISQNLTNDGFVVGACFDGKELYNKLIKYTKNESIQGYKNGSWIWKIIKNYENVDDTLPDDESSLGKVIKVAMRSINMLIDEYLVNFDYFLNELDKKGIVLLEEGQMDTMNLPVYKGKKLSTGLFSDVYNMPLSSNDKFNTILNDVKKSLSPEEQEISFFNRYFILTKKTDNAHIIDEMKEIIKQIYSGKGRNPSDTNVKLQIEERGVLKDSNFDSNFDVAKQKALDEIAASKAAQADKPKKKIIIRRKVEKVEKDAKNTSDEGSVGTSTKKTGIKVTQPVKDNKSKVRRTQTSGDKTVELNKKMATIWIKLTSGMTTYKKNGGVITNKTLEYIRKQINAVKDKYSQHKVEFSEHQLSIIEFYENNDNFKLQSD